MQNVQHYQRIKICNIYDRHSCWFHFQGTSWNEWPNITSEVEWYFSKGMNIEHSVDNYVYYILSMIPYVIEKISITVNCLKDYQYRYSIVTWGSWRIKSQAILLLVQLDQAKCKDNIAPLLTGPTCGFLSQKTNDVKTSWHDQDKVKLAIVASCCESIVWLISLQDNKRVYHFSKYANGCIMKVFDGLSSI